MMLRSVYFTDPNTGYAAGVYGTIVKTVNAGNSWYELASNFPYDLYAVQFTDSITGYVTGAGGAILRTQDAGETWTFLSSNTTNDLYSLCFPEANIGYAIGDNFYYNEPTQIVKTFDGGDTWVSAEIGKNSAMNSIILQMPIQVILPAITA